MLIVDDPAPIVHVYRCHVLDTHRLPPLTDDGRPLLEEIPNAVLERFIGVVERWDMRGKFSIVPGMGGRGDLVNGMDGGRKEEIREWLGLVRSRLAPHMDLCPEMITHNLALDLASGDFLPISEAEWSFQQREETLTPYVARALEMLREGGIEATGVTSPWDFGVKVEAEYQRAIAAAMKQVYRRHRSWYFLHEMGPESRPQIVIDEPPTKLVSIPSTVTDHCWQTIHSPKGDRGYINGIADRFLSQDGSSGDVRAVLEAGGWPILVTHWQSLFSNGMQTGLAVFDEVGRRVQEHLTDEVVWCSASEVMERMIGEGE
jgi:hypothetical protein